MKKFVILSVVCMLIGYSIVQAQAGDLKPTFLSPVPGLFVNAWPAFTVTYPKDWVEQPNPPGPRPDFRAGAPRPNLPPSPMMAVNTFMNVARLSDMATWYITNIYSLMGKDFNVLYDRPTKLKDGTPAQEAEIEWTIMNGPKLHTFLFGTNRTGTWSVIEITDDKGRLGEDLKSIAYSMKFQPEREKPVKLPPDVRAFFDSWSRDIMRGDADAVMSHYSDRFDYDGMDKAITDAFMRYDHASPVRKAIESIPVIATFFEAHGDTAYVSGFSAGKHKDGSPNPIMPVGNLMQLVKENGEGKMLGNKK
ncbi:MAG: hypothetical protein ABSD38_24075 [Syntrophorhabdales bacterium]|jgi:ketosteroid isomerase-like protein